MPTARHAREKGQASSPWLVRPDSLLQSLRLPLRQTRQLLSATKHGNTLAPVRTLDEQTGDGPDGLIVDRFENARALEDHIFLAWRDRAPTDWFFARVRQNPGRWPAAITSLVERVFVAGPSFGFPFLSRQPPEHAPTTAAGATLAEKCFEVGPARGGRRMEFQRGAFSSGGYAIRFLRSRVAYSP